MSVSAGSALNIQGEEQQDRDSFVSFDQSCMLLPLLSPNQGRNTDNEK